MGFLLSTFMLAAGAAVGHISDMITKNKTIKDPKKIH